MSAKKIPVRSILVAKELKRRETWTGLSVSEEGGTSIQNDEKKVSQVLLVPAGFKVIERRKWQVF